VYNFQISTIQLISNAYHHFSRPICVRRDEASRQSTFIYLFKNFEVHIIQNYANY